MQHRDGSRPFIPPVVLRRRRSRGARWTRRVLSVVALACIFTAWGLITGSCAGCSAGIGPALGAVRALVLAFVAGGCAALSLLAGARRGATALMVAATVTFLVAGVQLERLH